MKILCFEVLVTLLGCFSSDVWPRTVCGLRTDRTQCYYSFCS